VKVLHLLYVSEINMVTLLVQGILEEYELGEAVSAFLEDMYAFLLVWKNMVIQLVHLLLLKSPILSIYLLEYINLSI
ncbi:hypothetical protein DK295_16045, partial [Listeria monocytogenes]|uniref:hypothetical protein n=1 Tax=Listeria monocytogenes TaxID=1639 RepID=UPI000D821F53